MRRALLVLGGVLAALTLFWGALTLVSLMAHERTTADVDFSGIDTIILDLDAGGIRLTATEEGVRDVSGQRVTDRGLRRPSFREWVEGTTLHLQTSCHSFATFHCRVDYQLAVPAGIQVTGSSSGGGISVAGVKGDVSVSSSGGSIQATDTAGALDLRSSGGGIDVRDSAGPLSLHSSGGGIRLDASRSEDVEVVSSGGGIRLDFATPPRRIDARSSGGAVRVVVPRDGTAYAVDASSSGGATRVEVSTDPTAARLVRLRSSGGGVSISYPADGR